MGAWCQLNVISTIPTYTHTTYKRICTHKHTPTHRYKHMHMHTHKQQKHTDAHKSDIVAIVQESQLWWKRVAGISWVSLSPAGMLSFITEKHACCSDLCTLSNNTAIEQAPFWLGQLTPPSARRKGDVFVFSPWVDTVLDVRDPRVLLKRIDRLQDVLRSVLHLQRQQHVQPKLFSLMFTIKQQHVQPKLFSQVNNNSTFSPNCFH